MIRTSSPSNIPMFDNAPLGQLIGEVIQGGVIVPEANQYEENAISFARPGKRVRSSSPQQELSGSVPKKSTDPQTPQKKRRVDGNGFATPNQPHTPKRGSTSQMLSTPQKGNKDISRIANATSNFLKKMGATSSGINIAELYSFLQANVPGSWAFTGSVAMKAHGLHFDVETRVPSDVDILVTSFGKNCLEDRFKYGANKQDAALNVQWDNGNLIYQNKKIDILVDSSELVGKKAGKFNPGSLDQVVTINGVRVLGISSLLVSKKNADSDTESEKMKQENDIATLQHLERKQIESSGTAAA